MVVLVLFSLQSTVVPDSALHGPSLRWYEAVLADARLTSALVNSVLVAMVSSLAAVALGFLAAWGFARFTLPGSALLRGLITLPLTVSYLIIGMGLLVLFNSAGVPKSLLAAGIGHVVINLPLCFAIIYSQMGDASDQHRARRARPRRARVEGAGAGHRAGDVAGALRRLLPVDDLLLGRVRHLPSC